MTLSADVDMVVHFAGMLVNERAEYWDLEIDELGFEDEYERPVAWIVGWLTDDNSLSGAWSIRGGKSGFDDGDIDDWDVRVKRSRPAEGQPYKPWRWTEDDFATLVAAVPWLKPDDDGEAPDTSRMPGPNDRPLF